ncbi:replication initiation protein [Psychrilyobacter sp.]|uniref:replication initiation protein n=1 Tax=Psychrilyobacter sp. TaxID=2586924 RepID=UPI003018AA22
MSKIRLHKKVNLQPITFGKESIINTFYSILQRYNKQHEYEPLMIDRQELWEMAGFEGKYNTEHVFGLIKSLTKSETYNLESIDPEIKSISGSMFVITSYPDGNIKINVPEDFRKYLFYKKDIDLMYKAKAKERLSIKELDYYDKEVKPKSKFLVLLKKADILGIKGKYNKRLYSLLMQFKKTGLYFTTWDKFKEILEIPKSYKSGHIDQKIFTPAKKELLKVGIEILEIKKIKKGRSINRVEILFKVNENTKLKENQGLESKNEQFVGIEKKIIYTEKQIENAMSKCSQGENIPIEFLENLKKMSEKLFIKTISAYIE